MPATAKTPQSPIGILSISPLHEDHAAVRSVFHGEPYHVATAGTCNEALRRLSRGGISIVVCEQELPDGAWRDILDRAGDDGTPLLIVTSRLADDRLWAEVLNLGGFDVIAKPFRVAELQRVLESAGRHAQRDTDLARAAAV